MHYHKLITWNYYVIVAPGFEGGVEQLAFKISPGSYLSRSVKSVGAAWGNSGNNFFLNRLLWLTLGHTIFRICSGCVKEVRKIF